MLDNQVWVRFAPPSLRVPIFWTRGDPVADLSAFRHYVLHNYRYV